MTIDKMLEIKWGIGIANMDVFESAVAHLDNEWTCTDVQSSFTRVYMITDGEGYIEFDGRRVLLLPKNIYVIPAGVKFSFGCDDFLEKIYFHLSVILPDNNDILNDVDKYYVFENQSEKIGQIAKFIETNTFESVIGIKAFLYEIVSKCLEIGKDKSKSLGSYSEYTIKALEYIDERLTISLSADVIARALFTSSSKLRKVFKNEVGTPIGKYINERIMFKAEREVCRGIKSIKEISDMLGFCDQFYFSRCFSEKFGLSPIKYRKMHSFNL